MAQKNIQREQYANATKEEKARHNGVDTSMWGNDCPRMEVPEGWQDHQHTQQLIRKYLTNDIAFYDFQHRLVILYLTEEEEKMIMQPVDGASKYFFIDQTCLGTCLDVRLRKIGDYEGREEGRMIVNGGSYDVARNSFISAVKILNCTDDRKTVVLPNSTVERSVIEAMAIQDKDFRFLSGIGIEYALSK